MAHQPQNLVATPVSTTVIELSWDDVDTLDDESFDIERNSVIIESGYAGGTTYTDTGLNPDTEYTYRVRAVGGTEPSSANITPTTVAARATIFTPVVTISVSGSPSPVAVSAVAVVFVPVIETTTSTVTAATVVGAVSIDTPTIQGESYSDSYGMDYGGTGGISANATPSTVVTASTVLTPIVSTSPTQIAGLIAWYDFSDISTLWQDTARTSAVTTDAQTIKGVTDKSGTAHHADENTDAPIYKTSIINGRSVARFDGSNDRLNAAMSADTSFTVLIVAKRRSAIVSDGTLFCVGNDFAQLYSDSSNQYKYFDATGSNTIGGTPLNTNALVVRVNSAASMDLYVNGGTAFNSNPNDIITTGTNYFYGRASASNPGDYDIGEIVMYDSALSSAGLNTVGAYLATKWDFSWTAV